MLYFVNRLPRKNHPLLQKASLFCGFRKLIYPCNWVMKETAEQHQPRNKDQVAFTAAQTWTLFCSNPFVHSHFNPFRAPLVQQFAFLKHNRNFIPTLPDNCPDPEIPMLCLLSLSLSYRIKNYKTEQTVNKFTGSNVAARWSVTPKSFSPFPSQSLMLADVELKDT